MLEELAALLDVSLTGHAATDEAAIVEAVRRLRHSRDSLLDRWSYMREERDRYMDHSLLR